MSNDIRSSLASTMPTNDRDRRTTATASTGASGNNAPAEAATAGRSSAAAVRETRDSAQAEQVAQRAEDVAQKREEAEEAARALEEKTREMGRNLRFEVDDDSGATVIKVVDPATDEVVRQIPSEEAVARAAALQGTGLNLINESA